jgi:transposase
VDLQEGRCWGPLERMLRMDQVHVVRHKVWVEGRTQRAVARELGISRVTVQKYLTRATAARYDASARRAPGLGRRGASPRDAAGGVKRSGRAASSA